MENRAATLASGREPEPTDEETGDAPMPGRPAGGAPHAHGPAAKLKGAGDWLLSIVGLDLYTKGKAGEGLKKATSASNPFDTGLVNNCRGEWSSRVTLAVHADGGALRVDFWTRGRELGIDYTTLLDVPPGGFVPAHQRAGGDDDERGSGRRWSMWRGLSGAASRGTYQLVGQQEQRNADSMA
jgi:palmitoyltransferase